MPTGAMWSQQQWAVWNNWTGTNTTTVTAAATTTANLVWTSWQTGGTGSGYYHAASTRLALPRMTEEQQALHDERLRVAAEQRKEREAAEAAARARARETLELVLTVEERERFQADGVLEVVASDGNVYRIGQHGVAGNVVLLDEHGCTLASFCCHPAMTEYDDDDRRLGRLPDEDGWITQILRLRTDAEGFAQTANIHRRQCAQPVPV